MAERTGMAPHSEDCDSLDCPCYRNGQDDVLVALRVLKRMHMTEAFDRLIASGEQAEFGRDVDQ